MITLRVRTIICTSKTIVKTKSKVRNDRNVIVNLLLKCDCRVDDRLRIKVTDTGLSRDLFPDDYHCLGDNENRPIKWMALESITRRDYSSASDVVS